MIEWIIAGAQAIVKPPLIRSDNLPFFANVQHACRMDLVKFTGWDRRPRLVTVEAPFALA